MTDADSKLEAEQHGEGHGGHGTSIAAWVACGGVILGSFVTALAMILGSVTFSVLGGAVIVVAALCAPVLSRLGYGEKSDNREITGGPRGVR